MPGVRRLFAIADSVLRANVDRINDVGDVPYALVRDLLMLMSASQLHEVERRSCPQLMDEDEEVWKALCVKDFVAIRVMVEDGKMGEEPASWRALHAKEQVLQDQRMEAILIKMRGSYKDHADSRGVVQKVDGLLLAKRRKVVVGSSSSSKPKNLFEKARADSRRISSIYAPPRQKVAKIPGRLWPSSSTAIASTSSSSSQPPLSTPSPSSTSNSRFNAKVTTVMRQTRVPIDPSRLPPAPTRPIAPIPTRQLPFSIPTKPLPQPSSPSSVPKPRKPPSIFLPRSGAR